jgi:hypothetical protein
MVTSHRSVGRLPAKLEDTCIHTITCGIRNAIINNALCDLGAGVSVMFFIYVRCLTCTIISLLV